MRCPACAARNAEHARWCSQCFMALAEPTTELAAPEPTTELGARPPEPATPTGGQPTGAVDRDVREHLGEVEWRCGRCQSWAALAVTACPTCGGPRRGFGPEDAGPPVRVDPTRAAAVSVLLPGLGHVLGGQVGPGVARALLALAWLGGGLATLGSSVVSGVILLAGAAALWVVSPFDAAMLVGGSGGQVLGGRRLGALVAVVTGGLVAGVTLTAMSVAP